MNHLGKQFEEMTLEELRQELREAFLDTDIIDEPLNDELEALRDALNRKSPAEYLYTPEESWTRFWESNAEELETILRSDAGSLSERDGTKRERTPAGSGVLSARPGGILRRVLLTAAAAVLLAGAALAADSLGLWAWVPRWNAEAGRHEPIRQEAAGESPIPTALRELGITEPVYPSKLPKGFVITESHISQDPLILMEQYARGDQRLSITVTPIEGFRTAVYQRSGDEMREYRSGKAVYYVFFADGTITSIRYTESFAAAVSGDLPLEEMKRIMDSLSEVPV